MRAAPCGVLIAAIVAGVGGSAGADGHTSELASELAHAKALYQAAEREVGEKKFVEAARDYGAAYGITKDAVLFFKIASADEKAGRCDVAVVYYRRYLREAQPEAKYVELTKERIRACGGQIALSSSALTLTSTLTLTSEKATSTSTSRSTSKHSAAWLVTGGAIAFAIGGAVLAQAASSSEQDIRDLYVGLQNQTPVYDPATRTRYEQLLDEGHRYQHLSWAALGLSAASAGVSATLFTGTF